MSKRQKHFEKIDEYRERFEKLSTEKIRERLSYSSLIKEAAIALRQILEEREIKDSDTN